MISGSSSSNSSSGNRLATSWLQPSLTSLKHTPRLNHCQRYHNLLFPWLQDGSKKPLRIDVWGMSRVRLNLIIEYAENDFRFFEVVWKCRSLENKSCWQTHHCNFLQRNWKERITNRQQSDVPAQIWKINWCDCLACLGIHHTRVHCALPALIQLGCNPSKLLKHNDRECLLARRLCGKLHGSRWPWGCNLLAKQRVDGTVSVLNCECIQCLWSFTDQIVSYRLPALEFVSSSHQLWNC